MPARWEFTAPPPIERGSLQAAVAASGTVTPVSQVQVGSQVSGQIKELLVDFNSEVKQGQLIARIDPESFEYRVRQASADVEAARASVLTAQANVQSALAQAMPRRGGRSTRRSATCERKQGLVAQNFISPAEADTAQRPRRDAGRRAEGHAGAGARWRRLKCATPRRSSSSARRSCAQAQVDLERTQIRSPVDGIVIKRSVEVGQTVAASLQAPELFVIARNLSDMQVEAAVDEADISRIRIGQPVSFTIDAFPGRSFDGTVEQVRKAATAAQNVVTYTVVVALLEHRRHLLPGMTANVRVVTDTRDDVLKVPNAALRVRIAGVEPRAAAPHRQRRRIAERRCTDERSSGAGAPRARRRRPARRAAQSSGRRAVAERSAARKHRRHSRRAARRASWSCAPCPTRSARACANSSSPTCARRSARTLTQEQQPR